MDIHISAIKESKEDPSNTISVEEDIYLSCVYDLVEAAFAEEVESVMKSTNNSDLKIEQLDQLTSVIELLPFKSPQYETIIKPRLEKKITQAKSEL